MPQLPKPNTQFISWFFSEFKKKTLILDPKYQRNKVWSRGQQCFLIDSLISSNPIPQVFLNIVTKGKSINRKTYYEVVDGQQRLTTILEFMQDKWELQKINAKSYPVSEAYKSNIDKKYSELPNSLQELIWNYPLAVQELREWKEKEIHALFRRVNIVNINLNKQELRHSQYFGIFIKTAEKLADINFWESINIFTPNDYRRMKDVEFISELLALVISGIQDEQKTLDDFYANFDLIFPKKTAYIKEFNDVIESLESIDSFIRDSRFKQKADFYALFGTTLTMNRRIGYPIDLELAKASLKRLESSIENKSFSFRKSKEYHSTVIEGSGKLQKRKDRHQILLNILKRL